MLDSTTTEEVMLDYDGSYGFSSQPNTPGFLQYNFEAGSPINVGQVENRTWSIYPNPVGDVLHLNLSGFDSREIVLYDLSGKWILSERLSREGITTVDVSSVPSGMYIIAFESGTKPEKHRIIIQH
jgi:hypothetical protein